MFSAAMTNFYDTARIREEETQPPRTHILVVEDDAEIRTILRDMLEMEGYVVSEAASGRRMFSTLEESPVSLITLDLNLGGEDGLSLAREVRTKKDVPIIMISGKADEIDRVIGLEVGADDYIVKPFNVREVLARIRAVLRRYEAPLRAQLAHSNAEREAFMFDGWVLDVSARELRRLTHEPAELTSAEFNLLELFVRRPARVFSRDALMDALKGAEWSPLDRSIDALVSRLRKKIELDPERPRLIKTVRGVGYVFAGSVARA